MIVLSSHCLSINLLFWFHIDSSTGNSNALCQKNKTGDDLLRILQFPKHSVRITMLLKTH